MNDAQKRNDFAACAHIHVERFQIEKDGKVFEEQWRCRDCGTKFVTLDSLFLGPQKIQVMEPMKTLRDEFAMAAMQADALQSAIIAAAYIAQGKRFDSDVPDLATAVKEHYDTADAMMETRK